jgi:hypothetical protein
MGASPSEEIAAFDYRYALVQLCGLNRRLFPGRT